MNLQGQIAILFALFTGLIGIIYRNVTKRLEDLEKNGSSRVIYTSESRLNDLERRLGRLEDKFDAWMTRIEEKIDTLGRRA